MEDMAIKENSLIANGRVMLGKSCNIMNEVILSV
jgi:hypothetical protein